MATVHFTPHLMRFFPLPPSCTVEGASLLELVQGLESRWPGIAFYLLDEQRRLRENVAFWIDGVRYLERDPARGTVAPEATVHVMQALSGG